MIDIISDEAFERIKLILHGVPGGAEKALYGVISRATSTIRTVSLDGITSVYDISKKGVRDRKNTTINLRTSKVEGGVVGKIVYSGHKIPLIRFGVTPEKSTPRSYGVPVNIGGNWVMARPGVQVAARKRRDSPMKKSETAFIATMGSGHTGIFERRNKGSSKITERMGLSTAQMAANSDVLEKAEAAAQETIAKRTEHEITRILQGYGGR